PTWTKEETDYLINQCQIYDLRFIVIADVYDYEGKVRTVEDIKERYYDISKRLEVARAAASGTTILEGQLYTYDKAREHQRKQNLEVLFNRPPEVVREEENLYFELKRRENYEKKWAAERERLVKLFSNNELPTPATATTSATAVNTDFKKKMKKTAEGGLSGDAGPSHIRKDRKNSVKGAEEGAESPQRRKDIPQGVYIRSSKFTVPKSNIQQKFKEIMDDYQIPAIPIMPTAAVCDRFENLRCNVINLLDTKRNIDRQEHEIHVLRERKRLLLQGEALPSPGSAGPANGDGSAGLDSTKKKRLLGSTAVMRDAKRTRSQ
ncbi:swr complex subunit, partial [Blyttiomyces sp. JEL0837]